MKKGFLKLSKCGLVDLHSSLLGVGDDKAKAVKKLRKIR